jgi:hypothetical protein
MTLHLPPNVMIQIALKTLARDQEPHTDILPKELIEDIVTEWVNYFIDYQDLTIEDITFKLMAIEIPKGSGRVNAIINLDSKRSIIQIKNKDTICLARSIIHGVQKKRRPLKLSHIFYNLMNGMIQ